MQSRGKDFAKALFDSSVHKTGWKLILSQNIGKLLNVVVEVKFHVLLVLMVNTVYMYMYAMSGPSTQSKYTRY